MGCIAKFRLEIYQFKLNFPPSELIHNNTPFFKLFFLPYLSTRQPASHNTAKLPVRVWRGADGCSIQGSIPYKHRKRTIIVFCENDWQWDLQKIVEDKKGSPNSVCTPEILDCTSSLEYLVKLQGTPMVSVSKRFRWDRLFVEIDCIYSKQESSIVNLTLGNFFHSKWQRHPPS